MKPTVSRPSLQDVLNAFAVEASPGPETLGRYLRKYPEYATDLEDLSRELLQPVAEVEGPLSAEDKALIEAAWKKHQAAVPTLGADPFAALTASGLQEVAKKLGVRRLVITALRERKVIAASVPQPFLARLAAALATRESRLREFLSAPPTPSTAWSYKADGKPRVTEPVTFEQLLIDSGVPEAERAKLMAGE